MLAEECRTMSGDQVSGGAGFLSLLIQEPTPRSQGCEERAFLSSLDTGKWTKFPRRKSLKVIELQLRKVQKFRKMNILVGPYQTLEVAHHTFCGRGSQGGQCHGPA